MRECRVLEEGLFRWVELIKGSSSVVWNGSLDLPSPNSRWINLVKASGTIFKLL